MAVKAPLFSTYRQGENRVTSSMLAVFERVDLSLVERLLEVASEASELEMVRFTNQVAGKTPKGARSASVPDGAVRASCRYLFEVKTARNAVKVRQLRDHLAGLDGSGGDERLFVVTPDGETPAEVTAVGDERVVWFNFAALAQAMSELLQDPDTAVSEREAFPLRELRQLFDADGLLAPAEDVVVVAASFAYPAYLMYGAYLCQIGRSFRPGLTRMGFYSKKAIRPEFPRIEHHVDRLRFEASEADRLAATGDPGDAAAARLIRRMLADGTRWTGTEVQAFLLSPADHPDTLRLPQPIAHTGPGAWTQGQRYLRESALAAEPASTADLA